MKTLTGSLLLVTTLLAGGAGAAGLVMDLQNGRFNGVFIGEHKREFAKKFNTGGEWIGTWRAFKPEGYFIQPGGLRNMAGLSMSAASWPARKYGFGVFSGEVSFGIAPSSTLDAVVEALRQGFDGNFYVTLEEERGVWNRQFVAWQITGWKTDPPFYFEIFIGRNRMIEEIRLKSFPGSYYPRLLMDKALGPDAIDKKLTR
ncbi:MAG: hypothetical protein OEV92_13715 [Nitrospinota bacterium]|nr:hypothetical protein [Nitrospinota bacterium]